MLLFNERRHEMWQILLARRERQVIRSISWLAAVLRVSPLAFGLINHSASPRGRRWAPIASCARIGALLPTYRPIGSILTKGKDSERVYRQRESPDGPPVICELDVQHNRRDKRARLTRLEFRGV